MRQFHNATWHLIINHFLLFYLPPIASPAAFTVAGLFGVMGPVRFRCAVLVIHCTSESILSIYCPSRRVLKIYLSIYADSHASSPLCLFCTFLLIFWYALGTVSGSASYESLYLYVVPLYLAYGFWCSICPSRCVLKIYQSGVPFVLVGVF